MLRLLILIALLGCFYALEERTPLLRKEKKMKKHMKLAEIMPGIEQEHHQYQMDIEEESLRYINAFTHATFTDSTCDYVTTAYYIPLGVCVAADKSEGTFKGKWTATSDPITNQIQLLTYSKGKCRGGLSSGWSDSAPTQCTKLPHASGNSNYYSSQLVKSPVGILATNGVLLTLSKDQDSCIRNKIDYHMAERAFIGLGECFAAAGFADGKDVRVYQCYKDYIDFEAYESKDGSCTGYSGFTYFYNSNTCTDYTSLTGHSYGYMNYNCINDY